MGLFATHCAKTPEFIGTLTAEQPLPPATTKMRANTVRPYELTQSRSLRLTVFVIVWIKVLE